MKICKKLIAVSILLVAFFVTVTAEEADDKNAYLLSVISTPENTLAFYKGYSKATEDTASFLRRQISLTDDAMEKSMILFLLGVFRDDRSISTLIENFNVRNPMYDMPIDEIPFVREFPAEQALIRIGMPSLPAVTKLFLKSQEQAQRERCLSIIYFLYGRGVDNQKSLLFLTLTLEDEIDALEDKEHQALLKSEIEAFIRQYNEGNLL